MRPELGHFIDDDEDGFTFHERVPSLRRSASRGFEHQPEVFVSDIEHGERQADEHGRARLSLEVGKAEIGPRSGFRLSPAFPMKASCVIAVLMTSFISRLGSLPGVSANL